MINDSEYFKFHDECVLFPNKNGKTICHYDFTHIQLLKFVHLFQGYDSELYARRTHCTYFIAFVSF